MSQTTVQEYRDPYVQGQIHNPNIADTQEAIVDDSNPIYPGYTVIQGTDPDDISVPIAAFTFDEIRGIVTWSGQAKEKSLYTGVNYFEDDDPLTLLKRGLIAVTLGGTVAKGDTAFFVHTAGGASAQWTYRNDLDTDKASEIPATFEAAGISGDIVLVRFTIDAAIAKILT